MSEKFYRVSTLAVCILFTASSLLSCQSKQPKVGKITDKETAIKIVRWENPAQPIKLDTPVIKEVLNKTGVRIELEPVPQSNYENKKRMLIATNNLPDILEVSQKDLNDFAPAGVFLPLLDKINKVGPNFKKYMDVNPEINKLFINNDLYAFPVSAWELVDNGRLPMIRGDMLKKLSLKVPQTFEELLNVLIVMKKANPENIIWSNRNKTRNLITCVSYALGSGFDADLSYYYDQDVENGKFLYGPAHPEFKEVVTFLNKAFEYKVLDPDYAVSSAQQWQENLGSGRAYFYFDNASFAANYNTKLKKSTPDAEFVMIPTLRNNMGQTRNFKYSKDWWISDQYAVYSKSKNADIAVKLLDWMYSEEGALVTNYGVLNQHYTLEKGKPVVKPEILEKYKDMPDVFRAMQSNLGTGYLAFSPYVDCTIQLIAQPDLVPVVKAIEQDKNLRYTSYTPYLIKGEMDKVMKIRTELDAYFEKEIDKFITGVSPISAYDEVIKQLKAKGADELEKILNDANAKFKK